MLVKLGIALALAAGAMGSAANGPHLADYGGVGASAPPKGASQEVRDAYRAVYRDWRRALAGKPIRLGAVSDGIFHIHSSGRRVVLEMPPLRARWLPRTRAIVDRRYGDAPVSLRLAPLARPATWGSSGIAPEPGRPLPCPAPRVADVDDAFNAKRLVGHRIDIADRAARRHGCTIRAVVIDGMSQAGTSDLRYDRINVVVRGKRVVRITGIA